VKTQIAAYLRKPCPWWSKENIGRACDKWEGAASYDMMAFPHPFFLAAAAGHGEQRVIIFFAQVLLLIAVDRLLGEWMQRIG
jgi:hypothetical protein